jgi:endoglucanase
LCAASGVCGFEAAAAAVAVRSFAPYADEVHGDAMGNVIAVKRAQRGDCPAPRVLLAGHLDEIGLMVTAVDKGFLRFTSVGGFDERVLPGQEVLVHARRPLPGVIGFRPPHVIPPDARDNATSMTDLFVDVGLTQEDVAALVSVGDVMTLARDLTPLRNGRLAAKAMDDRSAVAVLAETLRMLANTRTAVDVYAVATVQEEAGDYLGARSSGASIRPDIAVAIDVTHADLPDGPDLPVVLLGKGPGIGLGPNLHPLVYERLVATAQELEIPWQADPCPGWTGTDAWVLQTMRDGVPTALLDIPLRYMHSSVEMLEAKDVTRTARLLAEFISGLDAGFIRGLGGRQND